MSLFFENPLLRQYAVIIVANLGLFCTGLDVAWPSPVLVKLRDANETVLHRPITEEEGSWIVSLGYFFGIFSNFLPSLLLDRIGRKPCLLLTAAPRLAAGLLFTFASDTWMLLLGRVTSNIFDMCVFSVVPVYVSEIASTKVRGALGSIFQIMCSLGIVVMLSMGPFTSYVTLNVIYTGVVVVTFAPLLLLPESPYFLYAKGRTTEALKVLTFLRGSEVSANEEIKEYELSKPDEAVSRRDLLKSRIFLKAFGISTMLGVGAQLVGYNAVTFYLQTVLESTQTSVAPETASVIIGLIQLTASICTALVTDRFGRKRILSITLVGITVGMVGLGAFFKIKEGIDQITGALNYLPLISLILVAFCYSAGLGSVIWPLSAELFDGPSRAFGMTISSPFSILFVFLTTKYFALVTSAIGPAPTYWMFSVNCVLLCMFILFCVPETKGKTFAEIQGALGSKSSHKPRPVLRRLDFGWPSPVLVKLRDANETVLHRPITEEEGSWIVSIGYLFGIFANFLPALLLDRIGRKPCLLLASVPRVAAGLLFTFASDTWMLLLGRIIINTFDMCNFTVVLVYASEIASTKVRGALGSFFQIMCSLGVVVMLSMGPFTSYVTLNVIYTCVVVVIIAPLLLLPENPYFLYTKGRTAEALKVLTFLRGSEASASEEIKEYALSKPDEAVRRRDLLKSRIFLKAFGISAILGAGIQLVGFNAVTFYLQTILELTQTSVAPETASVIIGLIQLTASICTALVTDRFGRKPILFITLVGMTVGMVGLGAFFKIKEGIDQITGALNYLPLISLILVVFCYSAGLGSVIWPLAAELFDGPSRAFGMTSSTPFSTLFIFLTTKYFALLTSAIGPAPTYWMFSVNCMLLCVFILFCVPETKGKTFAEIQGALGSKSLHHDEETAKTNSKI